MSKFIFLIAVVFFSTSGAHADGLGGDLDVGDFKIEAAYKHPEPKSIPKTNSTILPGYKDPYYGFGYANEIPGMLNQHNRIRSTHKLPPVKWSGDMAKFAQQWADVLAKNNKCKMKHRPEKGAQKTSFGENIFWGSAAKYPDGRRDVQKIPASKVVGTWAAEKKYFNHRINQCFPGQDCYHYTQLIWRTTSQVGCAKSLCPDKGQIWVCNYNPPGNLQGVRPLDATKDSIRAGVKMRF